MRSHSDKETVMERRTFLVALPAIAAVLRTQVADAAAQDVEFVRAWERAQQLRPRILTPHARIAAAAEPGTPLVIAGRVLGRDGRSPAPGVIVFAYHTDARGLYDDPRNGPHSWRLKGWALTDADGRFEFETIRPAPYPNHRTAAHVHISLEGAGVQRRWAGLVFDDDPLVSAAERAASTAAGRFGSVRPVVTRDGVQRVELAISITDEGVF
jgi:protocatechuate 3,4-dioxygenase, beta subunit